MHHTYLPFTAQTMSRCGLLFYELYTHKYSNSLYGNCSSYKCRNCNITANVINASKNRDFFFLNDRFHNRPFLDVYTATIKLSAQEKKPTSNSLFLFITLHWNIQTFQNFLTSPLSYSPFLGIFHLESTSSAKAGRQFINCKPFSATVLAFT